MSATSRYIKELLGRGRYHFTIEEAVRELEARVTPLVRSLRRLIAKGELASPRRGFYVVVPPEYQALGCLPAEHFVPLLMETLGEPYHAALLSAAALHGAAHQRPQRFQVMVRRPHSPIECGKVRVDFFVRGALEQASTIELKTPRGYLRVSSPEATALELVGYVKHAGGLSHIAIVLAELAETLDPDKLAEEASQGPLAWAQRLGFLLEEVEAETVATRLQHYVSARAGRVVPLDATASRTGAARSARWKIAINAELEVDQ